MVAPETLSILAKKIAPSPPRHFQTSLVRIERHPFSTAFRRQPGQRNILGQTRACARSLRKSFTICTSETIELKLFRISTYVMTEMGLLCLDCIQNPRQDCQTL